MSPSWIFSSTQKNNNKTTTRTAVAPIIINDGDFNSTNYSAGWQ